MDGVSTITAADQISRIDDVEPPPHGRVAAALVLLSCGIAAVLGFHRLGTKPFWLDEAASISAARRSLPDLARMLPHSDANSGSVRFFV